MQKNNFTILRDWRTTLRQGIRFGWVGGSATITHVVLYDALVRHAQTEPMIANLLAFLLAFSVSFFGHFYWTFKEQRSGYRGEMRRAMFKFFVVALTGLALNSLFVFIIVHVLKASHVYAIFFMVLVVPALLFFLNKAWAFANPSGFTPH